MSDRFPGGFITKSPVAPTISSASGVWKLSEALQYIKAGTWPTPQYDPYFNYVTALLPGDGVNNAQNNTFLDSSTNNFTITRNGNTTQGSFSPYWSNWGNYFDGSGDYLAVSYLATNFGTADFTVETWVYPTARSASPTVLLDTRASGTSNPFVFGLTATNGYLYYYNGSVENASTTTVPLNTWSHVAISRSGTTARLFVNGVQVLSVTDSSNLTGTSTGTVRIGQDAAGGSNLTGYFSNFRVVKGTAVYTAAFTPPTSPLTAISGTSLLTCQSNRFIDNSTNNFAITVAGDTNVQVFNPFNPSAAYSASAFGGSGYFDGSGDYLTGTAPNLSGTWTVEFWWYPTAGVASQQTLVSFNSGANTGINIWSNASAQLVVDDGANAQTAFSTVTFKANQWNHVAIVRNSTTTTGYINGAVAGSNSFTPQTTNAISVGRYNQSTFYYASGYISDVRVVNGTAVYTAAFTPPTAPLTAITNTSLLLSCTNAAIYDFAASADYETVADTKVSTSVVKYGTGSMAFDGTGDYLPSTSNLGFQLGTGDFTIEGWTYFTNTGNKGILQISTTAGGLAATTANTIALAYYNNATYGWILYANGTSTYVGALVDPLNIWVHFAVVRISSVTKLYINGTLLFSLADTTNYTGTYLCVGGYYSTGYLMTGYIDDLRITKGVGRYPYNFTPPTRAYPTSSGGTLPVATSDPYFSNTALLLPGNGTNGAQNNTFLDSSTNAFTITRNGNTTQGTFTPFSQTGWSNNFVRSSSGYLSVSGNNVFNFGSSDWTVEAWVNLSSMPTSNDWPASYSSTFVLACTGTPSAGDGINCIIGSTQIFIQNNDTKYGAAIHGLAPGQWNHLAYTRSGNTLYFFVNGNLVGNGSFTGAVGTGSTTYIGCETGQGAFFDGYISNLRVVKNAALYTASFTPPTAPLTTTVSSGTVSLLTCQNNRFLDNSSNALAFTPSGSPTVQALSPFAPTSSYATSTIGGSGYFDGSGDYLTVADATAFNLSGGTYTIEGWINPNGNYSNYRTIVAKRVDGGSGTTAWEVYLRTSTGVLSFFNGTNYESSVTPVANTWSYFAAVYDGTNINLYLNGTRVLQTAVSNTNISASVKIGSYPAYGEDFFGYISDLRITKGAALYSGTTMTIPTAPLTTSVSSGTVSLLCNFTNAAITDATAKNDLETVGNAQISTTQSKFGGSSMYFDGSGDWLASVYTQNFAFGTGDFTIEGWFYNSAAQQASSGFFSWLAGSTYFVLHNNTASYPNKFALFVDNYGAGPQMVGNTTLALNTWYHVALTRYGGVWRLFVNGNLDTTTYTNSAEPVPANAQLRIGLGNNSSSAGGYTGYIDDFRITKGIARYTSNFTPPTSAFATQ